MTRLLFYKFQASNLSQHWLKWQNSQKHTPIFLEIRTFICLGAFCSETKNPGGHAGGLAKGGGITKLGF